MSIKLKGAQLAHAQAIAADMARRRAAITKLVADRDRLDTLLAAEYEAMQAAWGLESRRLCEGLGIPADEVKNHALDLRYIREHGDAYVSRIEGNDSATAPEGGPDGTVH